MYPDLLALLNSITTLQEDKAQIICQRFHAVHIKKGDYFLKQHNICNHVGFLRKGLVRYFVYKNEQQATFEFTNFDWGLLFIK